MTAFEKFFANTFEIVEVIKSDEKNFVARVYDKNSKKLCIMKKRNLKSANLYKILQKINDEHIPEIYRIFEREENLILIEENIEGQTLEEIFDHKIKNFDEKLVTKIFLQICACLEKIHEENIIHRDLKPSNIMLTKNNSVKIIDFGIARIFNPEKISDTEFLGTRGYAAPEQYGLFDLGQTDPRTDIFNLGMTIKNLLGENYHGQLEKILNRCTNLNPENRYKNISELLADVKRRRKIFLLKRFGFIFSGAIIFFIASQMITLENKIEPPPVEVEEKISEPVTEEKISEPEKIQVEKFEFPEIKIPDTPPPVEKIPAPVEKIPKPTPEIKKADEIKIFFYLNGKLTENYGKVAGNIYVNGFENWRIFEKNQYYKWFLFPEDWTAQLKIENFTDKDLISPKIKISYSGEEKPNEIFIERPTVKAGQIDYVDIPIANKRAFSIANIDENGKITVQNVTLHVVVESPSIEKNKRIQLIRYFEVD